jgi:hypothetical protein
MEQLVKELSEPSLAADGSVITPNSLRLRAARAIVQLVNHVRNIETPKVDEITYSLQDALKEYREICSNEYYSNLT